MPEIQVSRIEEIEARLPLMLRTYTRYGEGYGVWAAERKSDGFAVGTVMLKFFPDAEDAITEDVEIGWHLGRESWGRGYATEMATGALAYGFDRLGNTRIAAVTEPENHRSMAVMERLGMIHRGMTTAYYGVQSVLYDIDRARWRALL